MNSLKSLFPDREGYVIMLTVLHKTRRDFMAENNFIFYDHRFVHLNF